VSDQYEFEEEEFTTQFNGRTLLRILAQARPYWRWLAGFLCAIALVSALDSYFTFLSKRIVDEGIVAGDKAAQEAVQSPAGTILLLL
jgi:ATP-binding cassette subfamily B protein